ncbi:uncharacterized protein LOC113393193 [Vanessa tameamea]|uniref:Uncharacterized protein LOC113393193 n=1 Tax=Vanessa tameamea TaxID=334116 RepID=A0A8B8HLL3_VANTA|nr:uncharacterized protein LOC113393193 [Vanessa tameamea]
MKQTTNEKSKKNGFHLDDDNVRYKINKEYFNNVNKQTSKTIKKQNIIEQDDDSVRYKFPKTPTPSKSKLLERKPKPKPKIKVNFWSNKQTVNRLNKAEVRKNNIRRHTVIGSNDELASKPKSSAVKVRKRVSFLPSPLFLENHIPMVTVPDDLTIQLNEEEANDLGEDLNLAFSNNKSAENKSNDNTGRKGRSSTTQTSPRVAKRKHNSEDSDTRSQGNEYELEFFSKYVVQKLRRMETNQRIYSENLINTVLMLGQLGQLNGKSKIGEA